MNHKTFLLLFGVLFSWFWAAGQTYEIADSLWKLAQEYEKKGDWKQASLLYEKAVKAEKVNPKPKMDFLYIYLDAVSFAYHQTGNYDYGLIYRMESYKIAKTYFPTAYEEIEMAAGWIGWYYKNMGNYTEALPYYLESLDNTEKSLGKQHLEYGIRLNNLASIYETMGQYDRALPLYLEALDNTERNVGKQDTKYGISLNNLAGLYKTIGQYEKSKSLYVEALENTHKTLGIQNSEYGIGLNNLAELYLTMGQYDRALPMYLEAIENIEKTLGKGHATYGTIVSNLAELYRTIGQNEKALSLLMEALDNTEKALGKQHLDYGIRLNNLANLYKTMGQYDKAISICSEAMSNIERNLGKAHSFYGNCLNTLAQLNQSVGQYDKALPLYLEAQNITKNTLGINHSDYCVRLNNLATFYETVGQYSKALPLYLEALESTKKSFGRNHPNYGHILGNLAGLYESMGQYEKALSMYLEALDNTKKTLGREHSEYGNLLNNLAGLYRIIGQYEKALPLYLEALGNIEVALGKNHPDYGMHLNNLAVLYKSMGQYEKALNLYLEALEYTKNAQGESHPYYGLRLNNLAELYQSLGQFDKALPLHLKALENSEKSLGKAHREYGDRLNSLAVLYGNMGQYDRAISFGLEALVNTEMTIGKQHSDYGMRLNNLAVFYEKMGRYNRAISFGLEALENTESSLGKQHSDYGIRLNNLASFYVNMSQYDKALPLLLKAYQNIKGQIERQFGFMSETERELFLKGVLYNLEIYQGFLLRYIVKDAVECGFSFDIELLRKGLLLQSSISMRQAVHQSGDSALLSQFEDWSFTKSTLAKQYSLQISQRRTDLPELENEAEQMEAALTRKSSALKGALQVGQIQWQQVRDALPEKAAAIEFVSFRYGSATRWTDSTMYMALVLRHGDTMPHMIPLFEQRQLDSITKRTGGDEGFVSSLYRGVKLNLKEKEKTYYGQRLFELVWKPLDTLLQPGYEVYLSPSGTLNQLAFAAIPYDSVSALSDRYNLNIVTTTSALLREKTNDRPQSISIYGGVAFDSASVTVSANPSSVSRSIPADLQRSGETWGYLPGTLQEAESITATAAKKQIKVDLYKGKEATEESLKAQTGNNAPDVLHIATHGFFFPDPKNNRKEQYALISQQEPIFKLSENPLNRSGIVLAGANKTWAGNLTEEGREDGILTAYEASYLQLAKTKLVVLSACETGLGDIKGSEGVYGLQRAFKQAGAEYLLMSLWKVPDNETAEFMTTFYGHYFGGSSIEDAYQLTQKAMREKYRNDPYKWAGFVLMR